MTAAHDYGAFLSDFNRSCLAYTISDGDQVQEIPFEMVCTFAAVAVGEPPTSTQDTLKLDFGIFWSIFTVALLGLLESAHKRLDS